MVLQLRWTLPPQPPLRAMDSPSFSQEAQQPPGTVNTRKQNRVPQMVLHPKEYFYITCLLGPKHYQGVAELTGFHGRIVCGLLGENPQIFIGWVNARQILHIGLGNLQYLPWGDTCHLLQRGISVTNAAKQNEEPFIKWEEVIKLTLLAIGPPRRVLGWSWKRTTTVKSKLLKKLFYSVPPIFGGSTISGECKISKFNHDEAINWPSWWIWQESLN